MDKWYLKPVIDIEKKERRFALGEKVWIIKRQLLDYYELYEYWKPGLIIGYKDIGIEDIHIYLVYSRESEKITEHYSTLLFKLDELPEDVKSSSDHEYSREFEYYYRVIWSIPKP